MKMRELMNAVVEGFDTEIAGIRGWISPDGEIHEVDRTETHAEWGHANFETEDSGEEWLPDVAFDKMFEAGWIRYTVSDDHDSFYVNCIKDVTRRALASVLTLAKQHHATVYGADVEGTAFQEFRDYKHFFAFISNMMRGRP